MAAESHTHSLPMIAASAIAAFQPVGLCPTGDLQRRVLPLGSTNVEPIGIAMASAPRPDDAVNVFDDGNIVKVPAAASLGHGALIGAVVGTTSLGPIAAASGVQVWAVGRAVSAAAAGEIFSLYVRPRQLSGLA